MEEKAKRAYEFSPEDRKVIEELRYHMANTLCMGKVSDVAVIRWALRTAKQAAGVAGKPKR